MAISIPHVESCSCPYNLKESAAAVKHMFIVKFSLSICHLHTVTCNLWHSKKYSTNSSNILEDSVVTFIVNYNVIWLSSYFVMLFAKIHFFVMLIIH
jgi:hypothetical protein